jgi:hypothetical protein
VEIRKNNNKRTSNKINKMPPDKIKNEEGNESFVTNNGYK